MHSEWDEYSGRELTIEVALDAQGAAREIEQLRRYRDAYVEVETRIRARIDFVQNLVSNVDTSGRSPDVKEILSAKYQSEIDGLEIALIHLDRTLAEAMQP